MAIEKRKSTGRISSNIYEYSKVKKEGVVIF
jgi:hypothetical protein